MRRVGIVFVIVLAAVLAHAQTPVNGGTCYGGVIGSCQITLSVTAGNTLIVAGTIASSHTLSVSDTDGDSFSACAGPITNSTVSVKGEMFCAVAKATNAAEVITINPDSTAYYFVGAAEQYSGGYTVVDKSSSAAWGGGGGSTAMTSGATATTTAASELLVGAFGDYVADTFTQGSGWTMRQQLSYSKTVGLEDQVVSSTAAYTATATDSAVSWGVGLIVTLKSGAAALSAPSLSVGTGTYYPFPLSITCGSGALVCYTANGNAPTAATAGTCDSTSGESSLTSGGTFDVIGTETVKAICTKASYTNSGVTSVSYTITSQPSSYVPLVTFDFSQYESQYYGKAGFDQSNTNNVWYHNGGGWATSVSTGITGGALAYNGPPYGPAFSADQFAQATVTVSGTSTVGAGVLVRATPTYGSANGYYFVVSATTAELGSANGSTTVIHSGTGMSITSGSVVRLAVVGSTLYPTINGQAVPGWAISYTDATYSTGKPGIVGNDLGGVQDTGTYAIAWRAGNVSGSATAVEANVHSYADSFTRPDMQPGLGAVWDSSGQWWTDGYTFGICGNQACANQSASGFAEVQWVPPIGPNQYAQIQVTGDPSNGATINFYATVRMNPVLSAGVPNCGFNCGDLYGFYCGYQSPNVPLEPDSPYYHIERLDSVQGIQVVTFLAISRVVPQQNDVLRCEAMGNRITLFVNGVPATTAIDLDGTNASGATSFRIGLEGNHQAVMCPTGQSTVIIPPCSYVNTGGTGAPTGNYYIYIDKAGNANDPPVTSAWMDNWLTGDLTDAAYALNPNGSAAAPQPVLNLM